MFRSPHTLMVQGTTSDAGKSILVTALCRILARSGVSVAPFKSQNMSLNSAVTADGGEIGRAQAVQAQACFVQPNVLMNPVLLKPNSELGAQVIVNGKAIGNMKAAQYHQFKPGLLPKVVAAHTQLQQRFQAIIVEGAGSPAEINLREHDIANMGFAEAVDCPVIIVADIDRGGVFAHLYGTYALLSDSEKARVRGFVINRFRGDVSLLEPGLRWLHEKTQVPVLGVLPYIPNLHIEAEDSIAAGQFQQRSTDRRCVRVVVLMYPRTSNHTDFDALRMHPDVDCQFCRDSAEFTGADLIILPGSKNVRGDLQWLKDMGWPSLLDQHLRYGGKVLGICGGFQMLGEAIHDPQAVEGIAGSSVGLAYLDMETVLTQRKTLRHVRGSSDAGASTVSGYEIHAGISHGPALERPLLRLCAEGEDTFFPEGAVAEDGRVRGCYVHGLFDEQEFLCEVLAWAGLEQPERFDYLSFQEEQIERLANEVERSLALATIKSLLSLEEALQ